MRHAGYVNDSRPPAIVSLERLRASLADPGLQLPLDGAAEQRDAAASAVRQIDDYIRPRLADLDAPLLAVVGGSTGSGKSTIVNALIGTPTTRAGVIRPTTRQPILVHAPVDAGWFASDRILPGLARVRGRITDPGTPASAAGDTPTASRINELMLLAHDKIPASLALIDAPDIDSVADDNRALGSKTLYFKQAHPDLFAKLGHPLCVRDFLHFRMTGEVATDPSSGPRNLAMTWPAV